MFEQRQCRSGGGPHEELHHKVEGRRAWRSVSEVAPVPQRPRVVSVEAVDLVVEGRERLLLYGLHGDLVRAAAQLREGRPALAAFLQHLLVLEMPDVGHRLLRHALDLALLLARAVGLDREDAVLSEHRPTYSRISSRRRSQSKD